MASAISVTIGSGNGLAITWTNIDILLIGYMGTNLNKFESKYLSISFLNIHIFINMNPKLSFTKMDLKMLPVNCLPFWTGLNMLSFLPSNIPSRNNIWHHWKCRWEHSRKWNFHCTHGIQKFLSISKITRTTRMPAFWDTPHRPMITQTSEFTSDPKSKEDKVQVTILKNCQKF